MNNYTNQNLISIPSNKVPAGTLAMKVGQNIFTAGAVVVNKSTDFYKCTYVSSDSSMTWSGRKAVLNEGVYSFQSDSTEGLSYSVVYPILGSVYTQDALVKASLYQGLPSDGLLVYVPLASHAATAATGQTLTQVGTVTYTTVGGIPCAYLDGQSAVTMPGVSLSDENGFTFSAWCFPQDSNRNTLFTRRNDVYGCQYYFGVASSKFVYFSAKSSSAYVAVEYTPSSITGMIHTVFRYINGTLTIFINGNLVKTANTSFYSIESGDTKIGMSYSAYAYQYYKGYVAGVRLYNRALSQVQIAALYNEFTPTA